MSEEFVNDIISAATTTDGGTKTEAATPLENLTTEGTTATSGDSDNQKLPQVLSNE